MKYQKHRSNGSESRGSNEGREADESFEDALFGRASRRFKGRAADHKTLQLCRQVQRALSLALAGECGDDQLREVYVEAVEPMGAASQLLVRISVPAGRGLSPLEVLERLDRHSAKLRGIVARAICRKRVPTLTFSLAAAGGQDIDMMEGGASCD